jgi:hypothetical protein
MPVAVLAAVGLAAVFRPALPAIAGLVVGGAVGVGVVPATVQASVDAPVFRALHAVDDALGRARVQPVVAMHHAVARSLRGETLAAPQLPAPLRYEWLELARYWASGGTAPIWFLANAQRSDLALVDRAAMHEIGSYRWPFRNEALLGGARPAGVTWYEIRQPGWIALSGWGVNPEVETVTRRDRLLWGTRPASALVRRRETDAVLVLGGRNAGEPCAAHVTVIVRIDGREIRRIQVAGAREFMEMWELPPGSLSGAGQWATLEVEAKDASGVGRCTDVWYDQFDLQSVDTVTWGLELGWFPPEGDTRSPRSWRWMAGRAIVRVNHARRDLQLRISGEGPRRYFGRPSRLRVTVGARTVAQQSIFDDFTVDTVVPAAALAAEDGRVVLSADQTFVPEEVLRNGDRRTLALRIHRIEVRPFEAGRGAALRASLADAAAVNAR